jgi:phosphoribosyl 1,2-cyclic phosphate phosphodiesterase
MTIRVTILGCGSSGGIPRPALGWGDCNPNNPKNRRRRTSLLVEQRNATAVTRVLVDTSPDLREQLLDAQVDWIDAVLYSHEHADHTHGIDDLRCLFINRRRRVPVYLDEHTAKVMHSRFGYCFETRPGSDYPPIVRAFPMTAYQPITIDGEGGPIDVLPLLQDHGDIKSFAFRFGPLAYSCDLKDMPPETAQALGGLDVWIVDALRYKPHPTHLCVEESLAWIARLNPKRAILTNLHCDLDFDELSGRLPGNVEPAYDGLRIEFPDA